MAYNENIGGAISKFDKALREAGFSFDAERKILSILRSMEYQVELGDYPPISVIQHLQTAIQSWIGADGQNHKGLITALEKCVKTLLKEIRDADQTSRADGV
jgi:hypothetical protein